MKQYLTSLPVPVAPDPGETLFLYHAATTKVISMVLVAERSEQLLQGASAVPPGGGGGPASTKVTTDPASEGLAGSRPGEESEELGSGEFPAQGEGPSLAGKVKTTQRPVYYIIEVLHVAKARYPETHKLLYAILIASRKLRHYFQAHKIVVVTSYPLRAILHNSNATGNIVKWAAELAGFQLDFQPRHAIKSQVLTDFVAEWTPSPRVPRVRTMVQIPHLQKQGRRYSPDPAGRFFSTSPQAARRLELAWSSSTQVANKSSIWCSLTLRPPSTWQSMRP
jgi:hypothetical protein